MTGLPATFVVKLKNLGYELYLEGDRVRYRYTLPGDPPADKVKPLLDELRNHKEDVITHLRFKDEFNRLAEHLRQRDYPPENMERLKALCLTMDKAWQGMDYVSFKEAIKKMMAIPGILMQEGNKPVAAKVYSRILQDQVWIALAPPFQADDGIPVYLPEEIRNLRGATPDEIRAVQRVKKELGGKLIPVKQKGKG